MSSTVILTSPVEVYIDFEAPICTEIIGRAAILSTDFFNIKSLILSDIEISSSCGTIVSGTCYGDRFTRIGGDLFPEDETVESPLRMPLNARDEESRIYG